MKFKEWFEQKEVIMVESRDEFPTKTYSQYDMFILEKIYNLLKDTGLMDQLNFYYVSEEDRYFMCSNLIPYWLGELMEYIVGADRILKYPKEHLERRLFNKEDFEPDDNYYCRISINPYEYEEYYVEEMEEILNRNISLYTNTDKLYNEIILNASTDPEYKCALLNNYDYGVFRFKTKEEYDTYMSTECKDATKSIKNSLNKLGLDSNIIKIDVESDEQARDIINKIMTVTGIEETVIDDEDEESVDIPKAKIDATGSGNLN